MKKIEIKDKKGEVLFSHKCNNIKEAVEEAVRKGIDITEANLRDADLEDADLRGAKMLGVDLCGASLIGANLSESSLLGVNLRAAYLSGTNLSGADLSYSDLYDADLSGADLSGVNFHDVNIKYACFGGAKIKDAIVKDVLFIGPVDKYSRHIIIFDTSKGLMIHCDNLYNDDFFGNEQEFIEQVQRGGYKFTSMIMSMLDFAKKNFNPKIIKS